MAGLFLQPTHFVERLGKKLVQLRREILFRLRHPFLRVVRFALLKRDRRIGIVHSRRVGRELELRQERVDHVFFSFEQISQENLVLNELCRFALEFGCVARKQFLETVTRFGPVFSQERDFSQIESRVPKFRIDAQCFAQRGFGFVVNPLPHVNDATQILRFRQIRLARINRVQVL